MFLSIKTSSEHPVSVASAMEKRMMYLYSDSSSLYKSERCIDDVCGHFQVPDASVKLLPCHVGVVTVDLLFLNLA